MKQKYKVIDKEEAQYGRVGIFTGIEHKDGLKVLRFRKKGRPYPTDSNYTCGFYPLQLNRL